MNGLSFIGPQELKGIPYYKGRWAYISRVIARIALLEGIERVLELGPGPMNRSIVSGADTMGIRNFPPLKGKEGHLTFLHDATRTPWPFPDKSYDLFIALQVFEHLGTRQREAFAEARRVARHVILSMPYQCRSENHRLNHTHYLKWFGLPTAVEMVDNGKCPKAILYFNFSQQ